MRLYIKQKVFSWKAKFTVKNAYGEDLYFIEGEVLSLGRKLHIRDRAGQELAFVRQKVFSLTPRFFVEVDGREIAQIVKPFTFLRPKYEVEGLGWHIEGDVFGHDYVISDGTREIMSIHKKWMSWGDSYELDVPYEEDVVPALAVTLAIDAVMDASAAAASAAT